MCLRSDAGSACDVAGGVDCFNRFGEPGADAGSATGFPAQGVVGDEWLGARGDGGHAGGDGDEPGLLWADDAGAADGRGDSRQGDGGGAGGARGATVSVLGDDDLDSGAEIEAS